MKKNSLIRYSFIYEFDVDKEATLIFIEIAEDVQIEDWRVAGYLKPMRQF